MEVSSQNIPPGNCRKATAISAVCTRIFPTNGTVPGAWEILRKQRISWTRLPFLRWFFFFFFFCSTSINYTKTTFEKSKIWIYWLSGKEPACQSRRHKRCEFNPWVGKIPWSRKWQPTPVFLPGKSPGLEEPGGLQSMDLQRVGLDLVTKQQHIKKSEAAILTAAHRWLGRFRKPA